MIILLEILLLVVCIGCMVFGNIFYITNLKDKAIVAYAISLLIILVMLLVFALGVISYVL